MSDYRVDVSLRNARLLRAIEKKGYRPGEKFANAVGISYYYALLPYINLTRSPLTPDGLFRDCAWSLCDFLSASPSDLWSDAQLQPLKKNRSSVDVDEYSLRMLVNNVETTDPLELLSQVQEQQRLQQVIDELTPQQAEVIRKHYYKDLTMYEIAKDYGVSEDRIRQVKNKALRKLRHPSLDIKSFKGK